jgi:integrase
LKISKDDLERLEENPIELFYQGIKSPETKDKYTRTLRRILCDILEDLLHGSLEDRAAQLVDMAKKDPHWITNVLLTLSRKLKERTELDKSDPNYLNPESFDNFFKPIKKLLEMNDVPIVWKRIYATFPERSNRNETRGYTRQEIQKMLNFTNGPIDKAIILIAASSGIRIGGFNLTWEDVIPVYRVDDKLLLEITESESDNADIACAILKIYRGTPEEYPAFITPEAYNALMDYRMSWIKDVGREPKPKDPLFKKAGFFVRPLNPDAIKARVDAVIKKAGIRTPLAKGKRRHEIPVMNGFRRFFNKANKETLSKDSPLAALIKKEYMMDHVGLTQLDRNYFKTHVMELIEEYLNAVPNLTISDVERQKLRIEKLENDKADLLSQNKDLLGLAKIPVTEEEKEEWAKIALSLFQKNFFKNTNPKILKQPLGRTDDRRPFPHTRKKKNSV